MGRLPTLRVAVLAGAHSHPSPSVALAAPPAGHLIALPKRVEPFRLTFHVPPPPSAVPATAGWLTLCAYALVALLPSLSPNHQQARRAHAHSPRKGPGATHTCPASCSLGGSHCKSAALAVIATLLFPHSR